MMLVVELQAVDPDVEALRLPGGDEAFGALVAAVELLIAIPAGG